MGGTKKVMNLSKFIVVGRMERAVLCESSWKCALTLHRYISVTNKVKINEKKKRTPQ